MNEFLKKQHREEEVLWKRLLLESYTDYINRLEHNELDYLRRHSSYDLPARLNRGG